MEWAKRGVREIRNSGVRSLSRHCPRSAKDDDRLARLESEAKLLASVNHSNIAQICDIEKSTGVHVLGMTDVSGLVKLTLAALAGVLSS